MDDRIVKRFQYNDEVVKWADLILTTGRLSMSSFIRQSSFVTVAVINLASPFNLMIIFQGGDGTFLMGSSKILNRYKPILGINTDPTRSEGHLCLPKHYSFNIQEAIDTILNGRFRWFFRRRLRITLIGDKEKINKTPYELHDQQLQVETCLTWEIEGSTSLSLCFDLVLYVFIIVGHQTKDTIRIEIRESP